MQTRVFGRTGVPVSEIGFGAWGIGKTFWIGADDAESMHALDRAIDLGVNFIDTALGYGRGHSESLVGQVLRERGAEQSVFVATKVPPKNLVWPAQRGVPVEEVPDLAYSCVGLIHPRFTRGATGADGRAVGSVG